MKTVGDSYQSQPIATVWERTGQFKLFWFASIFLNMVFFRKHSVIKLKNDTILICCLLAVLTMFAHYLVCQ